MLRGIAGATELPEEEEDVINLFVSGESGAGKNTTLTHSKTKPCPNHGLPQLPP
jgi:hypothetical protein